MEDFKKLFYENVRQVLGDFKRDYPSLESGADKLKVLKEFHRYAHSLKGLSATMGLSEVRSLAEELEGLLNKIIDCTLDLNKNTLLEIEQGFNKIEKIIQNGE